MSAPTQFRKKPVVISAIQWTGENLVDVIHFTDGRPPNNKSSHAGMMWDQYVDVVRKDGLKIFTMEGKMDASIGDWIIKGVKGEHYPCKPEIFALTYDDASASTDLSQAAVAAALEAAAAMLNDRGKLEQDNFGLNRATQNFFRARDMIRDMITPAQHDALQAAIDAARKVKPLVGWVIANGQGNRWRCVWKWETNAEWTDDISKAIKFATRNDAEAFSADDEDAWLIQEVPIPAIETTPDPRDAVIARLVEAVQS